VPAVDHNVQKDSRGVVLEVPQLADNIEYCFVPSGRTGSISSDQCLAAAQFFRNVAGRLRRVRRTGQLDGDINGSQPGKILITFANPDQAKPGMSRLPENLGKRAHGTRRVAT